MIRKPLPTALLQESSVDDRLLRAYREAVRKYAGKSWVTGITVSCKETDGKLARRTERVIAIHVRHKRRLSKASAVRIPSTILDVPTDVIHGDYRRGANGASGVVSGLAPGASISCTRGSAGTMGAIVQQQRGDRCLLTAAHVLRECGKCKKVAEILHPGRADAATGTPAPIARLADVHFGLDSGIATLSPGTTAQNVALISGVRLTSPVVPKIDDVVEKRGRTTGAGTGAGDRHVRGRVPRDSSAALARRSGHGHFGARDSGAVWYLASTGAAIGLHVAGGVSDDNTYAVAAVLTDVMTELDLVWT